MKVYSFGREDAPAILLLPGTCCHWKSNFEKVIPLLEPNFHVLCVSYDGFDETESDATFPTMLDETLKIEGYVKACCGGQIRAAYGCSLGGSFVGLLASRQNIGLDIGILGSSDLVTPLPDHWEGPTAIHIFYAAQMGEEYRKRYQKHFAHPVIHEMPLQHEELLMHYPDRWAKLVKKICLETE